MEGEDDPFAEKPEEGMGPWEKCEYHDTELPEKWQYRYVENPSNNTLLKQKRKIIFKPEETKEDGMNATVPTLTIKDALMY